MNKIEKNIENIPKQIRKDIKLIKRILIEIEITLIIIGYLMFLNNTSKEVVFN